MTDRADPEDMRAVLAELPRTSVIVVSRQRPASLLVCLAGLAQSDHPEMEIVVVACPAGVAAVQASRFAGQVKLAEFDQANISSARNLGISLAAGEVVAFIDDDAVPEPTWARRLAEVFGDPRVAQAGGFVRGRNGITMQWRGVEVDAQGRDHAIAVPDDRVSLHQGTSARTVKTQGTCCAFRRDILAAVGGFDPAFRFYLDEADVNLRLASGGHITAVVPLAQVVHGFAAGPLRRADRVPRDLYQIGESLAAFVRRHAPGGEAPRALCHHAEDQRRRLMRHMVAGRLEPRDIRLLMGRLEAGLVAGAPDGKAPPPVASLPSLGGPDPAFSAFPGTGPRVGKMILSTPRNRAAAEAEAREERAAEKVVTVLRLSPGLRFHRLWMRPDGIWEQVGGIWGRSDRADPLCHLWKASHRLLREADRLRSLRPV